MNDKARIAELEAQVASLEAKVALLLAELSKRKLSKDSSNSHNPPSQDKYKNKARQSLRKKSMRKSGGQPGHKGHTLEMVSEPTHDHELEVPTARAAALIWLTKSIIWYPGCRWSISPQ